MSSDSPFPVVRAAGDETQRWRGQLVGLAEAIRELHRQLIELLRRCHERDHGPVSGAAGMLRLSAPMRTFSLSATLAGAGRGAGMLGLSAPMRTFAPSATLAGVE